MEATARFHDGHPLIYLTDFFGMLVYHLFLNWMDRFHKFRSRCLPFLECLADSFAALDEKKNSCKISTMENMRSTLATIQNVGATPTTIASASNGSSSNLLVTGEEVGMLMTKMGLQQVRADDEDAVVSGSVDDISSLFEDKEPSLEEVWEAFGIFDKNGDGYIDAHELKDVLSVLGFQEGSTMDSCKEMIAAFDQDRDGRVDFHDFVRIMETSFDC